MLEPKPYPLCWPTSIKQCGFREGSRFSQKRTTAGAWQFLRAELDRLRATHVVISSAIPVTARGLPRNEGSMVSPAVVAYFRRKGTSMLIAADGYVRAACNAYAIAKTIESLRTIERYATKQIGDQAFSAFAALPPAEEGDATRPARPWREVLDIPEGLSDEDTLVLARSRFRQIVRTAHPDRGGTAEAFFEIKGALSRAEEECS